MALPLVTFLKSEPSSESYYELSLESHARNKLQQNFTESFTPILFVGQTDIGLDDFLPAAFANESEEDCLLVWPKPVVVQGKNLLLMKMWDFDLLADDEDKREVVQRSICVFLSMSEHCVVCFDRTTMFHGLRFLQSLYGELQRRGLHKVHFVVLDQGRTMNRSYVSQEAEYRNTAEAKSTDILPNAEWHDSERFFHRLLDGENSPLFNSIQNWTGILRLAIRFTNIDSNQTFFIECFPRFDKPPPPQHEKMLEQFEKRQKILLQDPVRKFLIRGSSSSCDLDESLITTLSSNFDQRKPTVVLTVMGEPGIGKSTFLNHLIQRALHQRTPRPYFSTGNTQTHTTRESFILSCPLPLPNSDHQMLLIDLEGLGGMETNIEGQARVQQNLVSGVLAIASVPCIFVKNTVVHQQTVVQYIDKLVFLFRNFGFQCNRIHFLFQDKDFAQEEQPCNEHMWEWIAGLNERYFGGRQVICLMNKPLFADSSKAEMCRDFLDTLLADCDYPKLNSSGSFLNVAEMIEQIQYITRRSSNDMGEIATELTSVKDLKKEKLQELEVFAHSVISDGTVSLVNQFNAFYRKLICSMREIRLIENQSQYLQFALETKANSIRQRLHFIEVDFEFFSKSDIGQFKAHISDQLQNCYDKSIWVGTFMKKCEKLEKKLYLIAKHYPPQQERVALAVAHLCTNRDYLKKWYLGGYMAQAAVTVGAGSLGMAATGARSAVMAGRLGWSAVIMGAATVKNLWSSYFSKGRASPKAHALFVMQGKAVSWVDESLRLFQSDSEKCVVLVIARKPLCVTQVLNSLVGETTELSSSETRSFQDGESAQVISFYHPSRHVECIMILLTLQRKPADQFIELIATAIFHSVSVCCLCECEESTFARKLLAAECIRGQSLRPRLCLMLKKSLGVDFKTQLKDAVFNTHLIPAVFEVDTFTPDEQDTFKLRLSECMGDSLLLAKNEAESAILRAQEAVQVAACSS